MVENLLRFTNHGWDYGVFIVFIFHKTDDALEEGPLNRLKTL